MKDLQNHYAITSAPFPIIKLSLLYWSLSSLFYTVTLPILTTTNSWLCATQISCSVWPLWQTSSQDYPAGKCTTSEVPSARSFCSSGFLTTLLFGNLPSGMCSSAPPGEGATYRSSQTDHTTNITSRRGPPVLLLWDHWASRSTADMHWGWGPVWSRSWAGLNQRLRLLGLLPWKSLLCASDLTNSSLHFHGSQTAVAQLGCLGFWSSSCAQTQQTLLWWTWHSRKLISPFTVMCVSSIVFRLLWCYCVTS